MIRKASVLRSSFIGIYAKAWDDIAFITKMADDKTVNEFSETLDVDIRRIMIDGSLLVGTMIAMNSNGIIVPYAAGENDIGNLENRNVLYLKDKINAIGNDIIANDHAAIIGNILTVGSGGVLTNKGMLVNPETNEDEIEFLSNLFKVPVKAGTANFGSIYVGASIVANSKGILVGRDTTPIEIDRIDDTLS